MVTKFEAKITFSIDGVDNLDAYDKRQLREFVIDALETWGGQRHPEDWLFGSLEKVRMTGIKAVRK